MEAHRELGIGRSAPSHSRRRRVWIIVLAVAAVLLIAFVLGNDAGFIRFLTRLIGRAINAGNRKLPEIIAISVTAAVMVWTFIGACCYWESRREQRGS